MLEEGRPPEGIAEPSPIAIALGLNGRFPRSAPWSVQVRCAIGGQSFSYEVATLAAGEGLTLLRQGGGRAVALPPNWPS